jgi:hypothetical protein
MRGFTMMAARVLLAAAVKVVFTARALWYSVSRLFLPADDERERLAI